MTRAELAKRLAQEAGELILTFNPANLATQKEGVGNWVTAADLASEKYIIEGIKRYFPKDIILSEETNAHIDAPLLAENIWIVDPIDGTNNFRFQRHYSCVSIAYAKKGKVIVGAVYDPYHKELFFAEKNEGAFLNGVKIRVGSASSINTCNVATDTSYNEGGTRSNLELYLKIRPSPWVSLKGSAVLTMCEVACGRHDLYFNQHVKPWDAAAAMCILTEAGARVSTIDGEKMLFTSPTIIAGNATLVEQFLEVTRQV